MNKLKKIVAAVLSTATIASVAIGGSNVTAGASGTGAGLAEHALNAYYEGWDYVWGGTSVGAVDCSGLIWMYCGGDRMSMLSDAQANGMDWGYVDNGIPRVHGLGLSRPNHVGVYIEDGMEVDARGSDYGVCYQQIGENGWNNWDCWFKLTAVSYPTEGWEKFNGNYYYYEDGEYIVNTERTIDGTTYYFDSKGHSSTTPSGTSSSSGSSSSGSSSSKTKSKPTSWSKGSNDDEVVKIQKRLAELGYYDGAIDGDFGDMTDAAFRSFQKAAGLTVDGIAGSDREVLYSDNAPFAKQETVEEPTDAPEQTEEVTAPAEETPESPVVVMEKGEFSDNVATVQSKLSELGYFSLEATGLFGDITAQAISDFQLANGLETTGVIDAKTYEILFSDEAVEAAKPEEVPAVEEIPETAEEETTEPEATEPEATEPETTEPEVTEPEETEPEVAAAVEETTQAPVVSSGSVQFSPVGKSNSEYAATASKNAAQANEVTARALEKSSSIVPSSQTAEVKRTANIWVWMFLAAAVLGVVAFVFFMVSRKHGKKSKVAKKTSTRAQLNSRW